MHRLTIDLRRSGFAPFSSTTRLEGDFGRPRLSTTSDGVSHRQDDHRTRMPTFVSRAFRRRRQRFDAFDMRHADDTATTAEASFFSTTRAFYYPALATAKCTVSPSAMLASAIGLSFRWRLRLPGRHADVMLIMMQVSRRHFMSTESLLSSHLVAYASMRIARRRYRRVLASQKLLRAQRFSAQRPKHRRRPTLHTIGPSIPTRYRCQQVMRDAY